jgi:hypothetical protein
MMGRPGDATMVTLTVKSYISQRQPFEMCLPRSAECVC